MFQGSTCTFCEAILRECSFRTGLFTSPHLIDVRERFRIDGLDISEDKFLHYFWDCWNQLKEHVTEDLPMPPLFQFLTILAFKIFVCEQVDVSIIEVGLGGKKDSTNVIKEPVVCGITSLGMDHTEILGNTLGEIASHKAGIFKPQIPAFTASQCTEAMDVLQEKADELKVPLKVVAPLDHNKLKGLTLSLSGDHQLTNASLAISLCKCWLQRTGNWNKQFQDNDWEANLPEAFLRGLSTARLSGRAQIVCDSSSKSCASSDLAENSSGDLIFYLDGAHSPESMEACAKWFCSATKTENVSPAILSPSAYDVERERKVWVNGYNHQEWGSIEEFNKISKKILLFNCMEVRDPQILLPQLLSSCASSGSYFSKAIFVPSMSTYNKVTSSTSVIPSRTSYRSLSWQFSLQRLWEKIVHGIELDSLLDKSNKVNGTDTLPPHKFLYEDASHCRPSDGRFACSTVFPSLPLTIKWLRECVRENPSLRVQVLVTGSLHLVGDVLKLLKR
uniref:Folylpolyglutamate synthase n=1 Tax=Rhizophora mucronata TaxID=61149 RepID=A0A2P2M2K6_RHIMU